MKKRKKVRPAFYAALLGTLCAALFSRTSPESTVTLYPPKQSHHVIYVSMCGMLEGIILTTEPVQFADYLNAMTPEMIDLEKEALYAGRAFVFSAGLWVMCGEPHPDGLEVIEGLD